MRRGRRSRQAIVRMGPTVLGEMQLPLHLRRDGVFFGGHQKRKGYWGTAREEKVSHLPQYDSFMGIGGVIGGLLEMLNEERKPEKDAD
jgi:hypothetical protein